MKAKTYVLTWPSDQGPCCLPVPAATFFALAASDPRGIHVGRAIHYPPPAGGRPVPVFFDTHEVDWVGLFCLVMAAVCVVLALVQLSAVPGASFEPPAIPRISTTKLV